MLLSASSLFPSLLPAHSLSLVSLPVKIPPSLLRSLLENTRTCRGTPSTSIPRKHASSAERIAETMAPRCSNVKRSVYIELALSAHPDVEYSATRLTTWHASRPRSRVSPRVSGSVQTVKRVREPRWARLQRNSNPKALRGKPNHRQKWLVSFFKKIFSVLDLTTTVIQPKRRRNNRRVYPVSCVYLYLKMVFIFRYGLLSLLSRD